LHDYDALHAWSVGEPEAFWGFLARYLALPFASPPRRVRSDDPMPLTRWFEGGTLSYARALLRPPGAPDPSAPAVVALTEGGDERVLSYAELSDLVARVQAGLERLGVGAGDHVVAFAANVPETLALLLACSGLGAVFASASPDFGTEAAAARFEQLAPKALFATIGYLYGGKRFDTAGTAARLRERLGGVPAVALPYPGLDAEAPAGFTAWEAFLGAGGEPELADLPYDHPLYVLFSSGTTGAPKALVHRAGGALLTHAKELALHCDVRPGDVVLYYTTCGWMMWNWLVSALACAATVVLYDGPPAPPPDLTPFELAERHRVPLLGTSARCPPGRALRPLQRQDDHLDGLAAVTRRLPLRVRARQARRAPRQHLRQHRHRRLLHARGPDAARPRRRDPASRPGRRPGRVRRGRPPGQGRARRAGVPTAAAVDAPVPRGRPRARALPRLLPRRLPGRVAARRPDPVHGVGRHRRPWALRRHPQPRRRAHRHRRGVPGARGRARGRRGDRRGTQGRTRAGRRRRRRRGGLAPRRAAAGGDPHARA